MNISLKIYFKACANSASISALFAFEDTYYTIHLNAKHILDAMYMEKDISQACSTCSGKTISFKLFRLYREGRCFIFMLYQVISELE